ncbi:PAP2 family protein [Helicobacter pylori]|uniref:PAP2 family protein n=1 Tax=Helicobacter pylori TaxID=210 RepID=UPI00165B9838|nr:PAP2 family protein [Helicobacter pylori]WQS21381.1 PAP2 family protein [Helicobacter pylori]WQS30719.1 PAP2 family protein [Helicobacter pylori]
MAENSFKNVTIQSKPFFLSQVKTLFLLGGVFSAFFILMVGLVFFDYANSMDNAIFNFVRSTSFNSSPILTLILQNIARLGSSQFVLPLSLLVGVFLSLYRKNLALGVWFVLSVILFEALLKSLKHLFAYSMLSHSTNFPNASALSLTLFYGLLILLIPHLITHQTLKNILFYSLFGLIFLIGLVLIVLGVSFSSVLGGFCLGALGACFSIGIYLSVFQKI